MKSCLVSIITFGIKHYYIKSKNSNKIKILYLHQDSKIERE